MRTPSDFDEAFRYGARYGQRAVVIHARGYGEYRTYASDTQEDSEVISDGSDEVQPILVGFVVSKAVGNAVTRNLIKRRMRAIVRDEIGRLTPGTKLVVRALPAASGVAFDELRRQVVQGISGAQAKAHAKVHTVVSGSVQVI